MGGDGFPRRCSSSVLAAGACFAEADTREEDQADRSHEDEFQGVPQQQEECQVQPFTPSLINEGDAADGGEEVDAAEEHRRNTPFQAASGADLVEEDIRRHPPAEKDAGADAGVPQSGQEHDLGLTFAHKSFRRMAGPVWVSARFSGRSALLNFGGSARRVVCPATTDFTRSAGIPVGPWVWPIVDAAPFGRWSYLSAGSTSI